MRSLILFIFVFLPLAFCMGQNTETRERVRVIATTDAELDDQSSMLRFVMYANEWDVEAIIFSASKYHWIGHNWPGTAWLDTLLDNYGKVLENLRKHDENYPSMEELKSKVYVGNVQRKNNMFEDTPGSDKIVEVLLDDDPRPVYLQAWGGTNTIARALWKIQHYYPAEIERVSEKAFLVMIAEQDDTYHLYINLYWPDIKVILNKNQFRAIGYKWLMLNPPDYIDFYCGKWMQENILQGHGALCSAYPWPRKDFYSEGDSPSFMHQIDVGLRSLEDPAYGGWGGRFEPDPRGKYLWTDAKDDGNWAKPFWRWTKAFQNDWAMRADWCVKSYKEANHPPVVKLNHDQDLTVSAGEKVVLDASSSYDPDGDKLTYKWWFYKDVGTYKGKLEIKNADKSKANFTAPDDIKNEQTLHIICEVTDDGSPQITRYHRVIVKTK